MCSTTELQACKGNKSRRRSSAGVGQKLERTAGFALLGGVTTPPKRLMGPLDRFAPFPIMGNGLMGAPFFLRKKGCFWAHIWGFLRTPKRKKRKKELFSRNK